VLHKAVYALCLKSQAKISRGFSLGYGGVTRKLNIYHCFPLIFYDVELNGTTMCCCGS